MTTSSLGLRFWVPLLRLNPSRVPIWSPCHSNLPRSFVCSTTAFLFIFRKSRAPSFSVSTSRFRDLSLLENKRSFQLVGVSLISCEHGSCSVAPCGALDHRRSLLLEPSLEFLFESPVKERSSLFRLLRKRFGPTSLVRLHYSWDVALYPRRQTRSRQTNHCYSSIPWARCITPEGW